MIKNLTIAAALLTVTSSVNADVREDVREKIKEAHATYIVEYSDGEKETILMKYEGFNARKLWQTGSAASTSVNGFKVRVKVRDDRKCHWNIGLSVNRRAWFVSKSGVLAPISEMSHVFEVNNKDDRGADSFIESLFYHTTCGDQMGVYKSHVSTAKNKLASEFGEIVAKDKSSAEKYLKSLVKALKISTQ